MALVLLLFRGSIWATRDVYRYPNLTAFLFFVLGAVQLGALLPPSPKKQRVWLLFALLLIFVGPGQRVLKRQLKRPRRGSSWRHQGLSLLNKSELFRGRRQVLCGSNPWALHLATAQATVLLPNRLERSELKAFLARFEIEHVFLCPKFPHPGVEEPVHYKKWLIEAGWRFRDWGGSWLFSRESE